MGKKVVEKKFNNWIEKNKVWSLAIYVYFLLTCLHHFSFKLCMIENGISPLI